MNIKPVLNYSISAIFLLSSQVVSSQLYMDELIRQDYVHIINEETYERESLIFYDVNEDGNLEGLKTHTYWDEITYVPVKGSKEQEFYVTQDGSCGNCAVFVFKDGHKESYVQSHELDHFWLNRVTLNAKNEFDYHEKYFKLGPDGIQDDNYAANRVVPDPVEENGTIYGTMESDERYYDWGDQPEEGESWVLSPMSETFVGAEVSSVYPTDENAEYGMDMAFDDDPTTAWFPSEEEGSENYPTGEYIVFSGMIYNESIWILNGYQAGQQSFDENARIKTMSVYVNGTFFADVILADQMGAQQIILENVNALMNGDGVEIKFVIKDVYPGTEYMDAGISEIFTTGG